MIRAFGTLTGVSHEHVGATGFSLATLELDVAGQPLAFTARGYQAEWLLALLDGAPEGTPLEVFATASYSVSPAGKRVFVNLEVADLQFKMHDVNAEAKFSVQGFVAGVREIPKRAGGSFAVGRLRQVAYGRHGPIEQAELEVALHEDHVPNWHDSAGQLATVRGTVYGFRSQTGRVWPRFSAAAIETSPPPSWLAAEEKAIGGAGEDVTAAAEATPSQPDPGFTF